MNYRVFSFLALISCCICSFAHSADTDEYMRLSAEADSAIVAENYADAAALFEKAIALRPDAPESILLLCNLAQIYSTLDMDSLAISTFDKAIAKAPAMRTARIGRGKALLKAGRFNEAEDDFNTVISVDSLNADARFFRAFLALNNRDITTAQKDLDVLQGIEPASLRTAQALASLYTASGREDLAIPYLKTLIEEEPSPEYYATLADCYIVLQNLSDAAETIAVAMERYPDSACLYYCRALLNKARYRLDDAKADFDTARKLGLQ